MFLAPIHMVYIKRYYAGWWWPIPLISAFGNLRQVDLWVQGEPDWSTVWVPGKSKATEKPRPKQKN